MNSEDFVTYEQALALKKLGFKEECLYYYNIHKELQPNYVYEEYETVNNALRSLNSLNPVDYNACDAPTLAQAQKWLRNEKKLSVEPLSSDTDAQDWEYVLANRNFEFAHFSYSELHYPSYEEALSAGITECLKLLEE